MIGPLKLLVAFLLVVAGTTNAGIAQNRFTPVIEVGDTPVLRYQLDQRTLFLSLLNAPGDPRELAREQLINEAIQRQAASSAGIALTDETVLNAMTEFAGRANLTVDQFVTLLGQGGVSSETFRDFVSAGIIWREYVRARFGDEARSIPVSQVERTLAQTGTEGGLRVLVSEILLPATTPETTRASRERAAQITTITSEADFAIAARQYSVSPSRNRGGALNWVALESLPAEIQGIVSALTPGQASQPVNLENAIGVFFLRNIERAEGGAPSDLSIDYALFVVEEGPAAATVLLNEIDACDDLFGIAKGLPEERLVRETLAASQLPADVRNSIAGMDVGEATVIARNGQSNVLMLCARRASLESEVDLDLVGNRLIDARLGTIAADHLADLRANTFVADVVN
ncbi:MAG: peptidylprolyl isomerase [Boseongicola sp.]|nr:peptidylprolyl isomerase [Boseongicola sp.]MDD9979094.1 peptidylprolyl isomerase [Boseongicola sp.]